MKVYEFEGLPNPARVRVALAEKNLTDQVEFAQIEIPQDYVHLAAWRARIAERPSIAA